MEAKLSKTNELTNKLTKKMCYDFSEPKLKTASETIEVNIEIVPYMIDNLTERINDAVAAVSGGVASRREGIVLAGITDQIEEELAQIEVEKKKELFED